MLTSGRFKHYLKTYWIVFDFLFDLFSKDALELVHLLKNSFQTMPHLDNKCLNKITVEYYGISVVCMEYYVI